MPSKALTKLFASLKLKKFRQKYGLFSVEGEKSVQELLTSQWPIRALLYQNGYNGPLRNHPNAELVDEGTMRHISSLDSPPGILAIAETPVYTQADFQLGKGITLVLDGIRDPGNLGTIIRTADWFGVKQVLLSDDCADITNAKCIMATMGSFTRVRWIAGLTESIMDANPAAVYGCLLNGSDLQTVKPMKPCYLVIGSESQGIRLEMLERIDHPVTIARGGGAESLNAAMAAGIALYEFSRA